MLSTENLISVVMPLYNKAAYVERAIRSVLVQGAGVLEVVVVDDGSTDDGAAIVEAMRDPRVRLIRQSNGGVSAARNRGIEEARGEFICFLDADDIYLEGFVEEIRGLVARFPQACLYATSYIKRWPDGREVADNLPLLDEPGHSQIVRDPFRSWSRNSFIHIASACMRTRIFTERGFLFPLGESVGEDQDVIFRLMEVGDVAYSPKPLMVYHQEVADSLYSVLPDVLPANSERLAKRLKAGGIQKRHQSGVRRLLSVYCLNIARINLARGQRKQGLRLLLRPEAYYHVVYWLRTAVRFMLPKAFFSSRWTRRI